MKKKFEESDIEIISLDFVLTLDSPNPNPNPNPTVGEGGEEGEGTIIF